MSARLSNLIVELDHAAERLAHRRSRLIQRREELELLALGQLAISEITARADLDVYKLDDRRAALQLKLTWPRPAVIDLNEERQRRRVAAS